MKIFLDTSSVIKLYHSEEGTELLFNIFERQISAICISEVCVVEFSSAMWKKARVGEITFYQADILVKAFLDDLQKFTIIPVNSEIFRSALKFLDIYGKEGLRTLDSIQLACAISLKNLVDFYSTFDDKLELFFARENLPIQLGN